ncbi:MAG: hypothetical protein DRO40_03015 [Thermoprotei archaeon]|nr:MAG: hypothetical protein DRO40_03015 [Thermoprotei archaeon]
MAHRLSVILGRIAEAIIILSITLFLIVTVADIPWNIRPIIFSSVIVFTIYLQIVCNRLWPRLMLPLSYFSLGLIISRMIIGAVPWSFYFYIVLLYLVASFMIYHCIYRIIAVFLSDRRGLFKDLLEYMNIDMIVFLIILTSLSIWLYTFKTIQGWAAIFIVLVGWFAWIFTSRYLNRQVHRILLTGQATRWGFAHPVEPEAEKTLLAIASLVVLTSLMIPLLFAYTSPILLKRGFIPLTILGIVEAITCLLYLAAYIFIVHGAFVEELTKTNNELVFVENYRVFKGWRDISWFLNRSVGYYYRLKYLSALYMLFQGLEIFSRRTNKRELYYGGISDLLCQGYNYVVEKNLIKFVDERSIMETIESFKEQNLWVIEANTFPIEKRSEEIKEVYRRIFSSLVNLYAKLKDNPEEAYREKERLIDTVIRRLENFKNTRLIDRLERTGIDNVINTLERLKKKEKIRQEDLEGDLLVRKPLTINVVRAYLVHGQLVKNAIVYNGSRDEFDKLMSKPSILYGLYTLILSYLVSKYPDIIHGPERAK